MIPKTFLYGFSILLALFLSYLFVNNFLKNVSFIKKNKYLSYVLLFILFYLLLLKLISLLDPSIENYQDIIEHITRPNMSGVTASMDMSLFNQQTVPLSSGPVVSAPQTTTETPVTYVDTNVSSDTPVAYTGPAIPVSENVNYTGYTGGSGFIYTPTGYTSTITSETISSESSGYTGYTGSGYTGYTGYTSYSGYVAKTESGKEEKKDDVKEEESKINNKGLIGLLLGMLLKQQQVNVNVYGNDVQGDNSNWDGSKNRYNKENCNNSKDNISSNPRNNELYNYPAGKVRAYDDWRKQIDKDNDYILMDQNTINKKYMDPRKSSCPVCPLDINYPFANYRSGK